MRPVFLTLQTPCSGREIVFPILYAVCPFLWVWLVYPHLDGSVPRQQFPLWEKTPGCSRDFAIAQGVFRGKMRAIWKSRLQNGNCWYPDKLLGFFQETPFD